MKVFNVEQNSPEWFNLKIGVPSTSNFNKIMNPDTALKEIRKTQGALAIQDGDKTVAEVALELEVTEATVKNYVKKYSEETEVPEPKLLDGAEDYINLLLAEMILNTSLNKFPQTYWMERGAEKEGEAADLYEFETDCVLLNGGFVTDDDITRGSSLDRLVVKEGKVVGGLEIKCPAPWTHVKNIKSRELDPQYKQQVQGQMLVYGLDFVDWFSYHPDMPFSLIRTYRDDDYISVLEKGLDKFTSSLQTDIKKLVEIGALSEGYKKIIPKGTSVSTIKDINGILQNF